jgi:hypothetical protein
MMRIICVACLLFGTVRETASGKFVQIYPFFRRSDRQL